ncbi:beta-lactamase family protein [Mycolicibacterium sp. S2-37]|uniref:serine hydrolase domain-containing protein n=1 Tax=Mycolicibacterium sp. S2-37 TaxID=2810297 RepID=UPI001A9484A2|nr:serine hydrolase domain-containing protein [Mycolicibacterium sp. S2-37]MBO0679593.1 beta-lactamase family protein [Mycolicibacterium sp. S2-37]
MVLRVNVSADLIGGDVDEGYGPVADAFRRNMLSGSEVGASVAVYRDGVKVVDLWGGYRDGVARTPWLEDTVVNMFSTTKGMASLAVSHAVSRGLLCYDTKVADYWPEFAQAGKADVTVRQLLAHQAGLCALDQPVRIEDVADVNRLSPILAAQRPAWPPGTRQGYHAITLGWYESELIRNVDPAGRTLGRYFADEIAGPLGLDLYIGLPKPFDRNRIARIHGWKKTESLLHLNVMPAGFAFGMLNPRSLTARALNVPQGFRGLDYFNREEVRAVEIPAANGIGTARSVARLYGSVATDGAELGLTPAVVDDLARPAVPPSRGLRDRVLHVDSAFSLGFIKPSQLCLFGSSDRAFGHPGAGGSCGMADPDTGVGFAYIMNRSGFHLASDPRELALRQALFRDVLGVRPQT